MKLGLRPRCLRCHKLPRGKMQHANYARYKPFCSYHCKEWWNMEENLRYLDRLKAQRSA